MSVKVVDHNEPGVIIGDVNGDGKVTILDATERQRHLAEFKKSDGSFIVDESDPTAFKIADYDHDKKISIFDVVDIQYYFAGVGRGS